MPFTQPESTHPRPASITNRVSSTGFSRAAPCNFFVHDFFVRKAPRVAPITSHGIHCFSEHAKKLEQNRVALLALLLVAGLVPFLSGQLREKCPIFPHLKHFTRLFTSSRADSGPGGRRDDDAPPHLLPKDL